MTTWLFKGAPTTEDLRDPKWRPAPLQAYEHDVERPAPRRTGPELAPVRATPRDVQVKLEPDSQPLARFSQATPRLEDSYANSYAATQAPAAALPHHWLFKRHEITEIDQLNGCIGSEVQLVGVVLDISPMRKVGLMETSLIELTLGDHKGSSVKLAIWREECDHLQHLAQYDIVFFRCALRLRRSDFADVRIKEDNYARAGFDGPAPLVGNPSRLSSGMQICWSATDSSNRPVLLATRLSPEEARVAELRDWLECNGAL